MLRKLFLTGLTSLLLTFTVSLFMAAESEARAGRGGSMGSRGSRSMSRPVSPSPTPAQRPQQAAPAAPAPSPAAPAGGGFLRSMAGGLVGGMLGGMLFRSLGFGGGMGGGGGGIGIFEILLLAGGAYLIYRFVKSRREGQQQSNSNYYTPQPQSTEYEAPAQAAYNSSEADLERGLSHIRQMDASFSEERFCDQVMDIFFKIQGSWMNRDLAPVANLLNDEMRRTFQADIDAMLRERKINRLENIAVRNVEISEAWQEQGDDFITALIYANLLDYTADDRTGDVISGSKTEPVKFEEYWTFTRKVGSSGWVLSAINQK